MINKILIVFTIPELRNKIFLALQIENSPLNENMFRDLFMLLKISLKLVCISLQ